MVVVSQITIGKQVRHWRKNRHLSQMDLAFASDISPRHLSFIETGRSHPSREVTLRISQALRLSLSQQNAMLTAAGYAPIYSEHRFSADEMAIIRQATRRFLEKHDPYPALVVNRSYDIIITNCGFDRLVQSLIGKTAASAFKNIYELLFADDGLRPLIESWETIGPLLLNRLEAETLVHQNTDLQALYNRLRSKANFNEASRLRDRPQLPVLDIGFRHGAQTLRFFSALTTFGSPLDVTTEELRIESLFPSDERTRQYLINNYQLPITN